MMSSCSPQLFRIASNLRYVCAWFSRRIRAGRDSPALTRFCQCDNEIKFK